jgi:hypothetical protein
VYPWGLQVLVAEYVRDILAKADSAQRARRARRPRRWRNPGLTRGAGHGAGRESAAQALIREGRSVPHQACGACWLLAVVASQHRQDRFLWPGVVDQLRGDARARVSASGEQHMTIAVLAASGQARTEGGQ